MLPLIKRNISKVPGWIAQILIYIILFLFMLYILCFFSISVGNIAKTSGLYNFSQNVPQLHQILENFPRDEVNIINTAGIVIMLFLWLLLLGIFKAEKGIVILPFLVDPCDKNSNGNAISEMLIAELKRIIRIHSVNIESNFSSSADMKDLVSAKNLSVTYPVKDIKEKAHLLQLSPKGENLDQSIQTIGTLAFGSTSIPIGSILIVLRNTCPGADPGLIISGCLQKSESDICLISYMKRENRSWHIYKKIENKKSISNEDISALVRELSYNIYYELLQLQSKQNISDAVGESSGKAPNHDLPNWEVLNYFTEAMAALQTYNVTKERKDLDRARVLGLKAASVDPYYNNPLYLLYNVGIAYINNLNKKDYYEAERLARYIVGLRPDSSRAWYSWGLTLTLLILNEEAIECYDKALFFDEYEKEEKDKITKDIRFMRAISLRDLNRYDEAIDDFNYFLDREYRNGYAWGHYGITLEAKAKSLDNANPGMDAEGLRDKAEEAFLKAIEYQHDFVSVHAALARIYRKWYVLSWQNILYTDKNSSEDKEKLKKFIMKNFDFNWLIDAEIKSNNNKVEIKRERPHSLESLSLELSGDKTNISLKRKFIGGIAYEIGRYAVKKENNELRVYLMDPSKECNEAQKHNQTGKQTGYNRACYEINCGNKEIAIKLLETEIYQNQISGQWLEDDSDWDPVRDEEWFKKLLAKAKNEKRYLEISPERIDIDNLILRKAVRRKLNMEGGKKLNSVEDPEDPKKFLEGMSFLVRARFHAASGDDDKALDLLYWALNNNQISEEDLRFEPDFEFIREKPRFRDIMEKLSEAKRID